MIDDPLLRWATHGAFNEHHIVLLYMRKMIMEAMEQEHRLVMALYEESEKRLEFLRPYYSPTPILRDVIDGVLEKNK